MGRHRQGPGQLAPAEHLDQAVLVDQARGPQGLGRRPRRPRWSSRVSRLTTTYSTRNGFLKPFSFGMRCARGSWPPSKPGLIVAPGALALGAPAGGLAALAGDAPADPRGGPWSTRRRLQVMDLHRTRASSSVGGSRRSEVAGASTGDEVGDPGDHAPDLGAVGQGVGLADAAQAEGPQRAPVLGLGADGGLDLGDRTAARPIRPPRRARGAPAGSPGRPAARRRARPPRATCPGGGRSRRAASGRAARRRWPGPR